MRRRLRTAAGRKAYKFRRLARLKTSFDVMTAKGLAKQLNFWFWCRGPVRLRRVSRLGDCRHGVGRNQKAKSDSLLGRRFWPRMQALLKKTPGAIVTSCVAFDTFGSLFPCVRPLDAARCDAGASHVMTETPRSRRNSVSFRAEKQECGWIEPQIDD